MFDDLLGYYERELSYIRRQGAVFAKAHPKIAGRLRIGPESVDDPHVSRLIEAFAFLSARIHRKLDDDFPELIDGMLDVLYPHYLAPIPSMAIAKFAPQPDSTEPHTLPRHTSLRTEAIAGEPCRFRTCYPVTLWPIEIESARLAARPIEAPHHPQLARAQSVLRLRLRSMTPDVPLSALPIDRLRFFLAGLPQEAYPLHELILSDSIGVALADSPNDPAPTILPQQAILPVGFERDEGMLDYPAHALPGYGLLTEFFTFPEKYLFFEITGLAERVAQQKSSHLEIFIYLENHQAALEESVNAGMFTLGCTPIVNLFDQIAEPIQVTHRQSEYRVVPDARRTGGLEVYSVDQVSALSPNGDEVDVHPFHSIRHATDRDNKRAFWQAMRRPVVDGRNSAEFMIRLLDLDFDPRAPAGWTLTVEATCFNGDLPSRLPSGSGEPRFYLEAGNTPLQGITCLTPPTPPRRPKRQKGAYWRLISHLNLNHLSLADDGGAGENALQEMLRLYDFKGSADSSAMVGGVRLIGAKPVTRRLAMGPLSTTCRGMEVEIEFDRSKFAGSSAYLLASVLERFLAQYCTINSFTQLAARLSGKEGIWQKWAPRAGDKALL